MPPFPLSSQVESHEERVQRLEASHQQLAVNNSEALLRIGYLTQRLEESHEAIIDHLNLKFQIIQDKLDNYSKISEGLSPRVDIIEQRWIKTIKFGKIFAKYIVPVVVFIASALGSKIGSTLWGFFSHIL